MIAKPKEIEISLHKIYSEDALELDALLFQNSKQNSEKIIIHLHGKEGHFIQNHFVTYMGYSYPLHGYSFLTFNNRGHDYMADMLKKASHGFEWTTRGAAYESIEESVYDVNGVIGYVKKMGYKEVILQGHSIGPHKICYYLANKPKYQVSKAILITLGDIIYLLDANIPEWRLKSAKAKEMIDEGLGDKLMSGVSLWSNAPVSAKTFWHYTNPNSNAWIFNFTKPDVEFRHFNKLTLPILVVVPEDDFSTGIAQEDAMKFLRRKTASKDLRIRIIKNAVHNYASKEQELVDTILELLEEK